MHSKIIKGLLYSVAIVAIGGCASGKDRPQFGDAVRHMTEQQTHNLDAAYNPDPNAVTGADSDRLNAVLETHRKTVADPTTAGTAPITINMPGASQ